MSGIVQSLSPAISRLVEGGFIAWMKFLYSITWITIYVCHLNIIKWHWKVKYSIRLGHMINLSRVDPPITFKAPPISVFFFSCMLYIQYCFHKLINIPLWLQRKMMSWRLAVYRVAIGMQICCSLKKIRWTFMDLLCENQTIMLTDVHSTYLYKFKKKLFCPIRQLSGETQWRKWDELILEEECYCGFQNNQTFSLTTHVKK